MGTNCVDHNRYDNEGNLTKKSKGASLETWTYGSDTRNHLTWVEKRASDGGTLQMRTEYKYDVFGNRIQNDVDADGAGGGGTVTTRFAFDGWKSGGGGFQGNENFDVWADLDSSNILTMRRLFTNKIDGVVARINASGTEAWYLTDRLGSVREMVDDSGTLQNVITYDGVGAVRSESNASFGDRIKFTARERDSASSLYYYRHRWYNSETSRWISPDPIRLSGQDSNLYRYVGNNATNRTDPSGLIGWDPQDVWEDEFTEQDKQRWYLLSSNRRGWRLVTDQSGRSRSNFLTSDNIDVNVDEDDRGTYFTNDSIIRDGDWAVDFSTRRIWIDAYSESTAARYLRAAFAAIEPRNPSPGSKFNVLTPASVGTYWGQTYEQAGHDARRMVGIMAEETSEQLAIEVAASGLPFFMFRQLPSIHRRAMYGFRRELLDSAMEAAAKGDRKLADTLWRRYEEVDDVIKGNSIIDWEEANNIRKYMGF